MPQEPSSKQRYPYTLTGGAILLLATAAAGSGFWVPFAAIDFDQTGNDDLITAEYYAMEVSSKNSNSDDHETVQYSDGRFDNNPGISALRFGIWPLIAGTLLALCAALTMFAAPSSSLTTARVGGWLALTATLGILVAVAAMLYGYMDQVREFANALDGSSMRMAGNRLMAGTLFMGAGAVLAAGGGILGFSDKAKAVVAERPVAGT